MKNGRSLLAMLAIYVTLASLIVMIGCGSLYTYFYSDMQKQAFQYAQESLADACRGINAQQAMLYQGAGSIAAQADTIRFAAGDAQARVQLRNPLRALMGFYMESNSSVQRIYLHTRDGSVLSSHPVGTDTAGAGTYMALLGIRNQIDLNQPFREPFQTPLAYKREGLRYYAVIAPVYPDVAAPQISQYLGAVILICSAEGVEQLLPASEAYEAVLCEQEEIIAGQQADFLRHYDRDAQRIRLAGRTLDVLQADVLNGQWQLYFICHDDGDAIQNTRIATFTIVIVVLILIVNISLMTILHHRIVHPIRQLVHQMDDIGGSTVRIQPLKEPVQELNTLTDGMNSMLTRIDSLNVRLHESKLNYYKERIMFLQTQINPHFLYNNLECVRGMVNENQEDVRRMVSAIAHIYRYCNRAEHMASLREELNCASVYARIIALRYDDRYALTLSADPEILDMPVPRMILQPLMENAIRHGFEAHLRPRGSIRITAAAMDDGMLIRLQDDGGGMDQATLDQLNGTAPGLVEHRHHIGVANVRQRLQLLFGNKAVLRFSSTPGEGTLAEIFIPQIPDK